MRPLGGRHAAVIPALPDEYENLVPIGTLQYHEKQRNASPPHPSRGLSYYPQHIIQQAQQERQQQEQRQPSQEVSLFTLTSLRYSRGLSSNRLSLLTTQKEISSSMISSFGFPYRSTFNCIPNHLRLATPFFLTTFVISIFHLHLITYFEEFVIKVIWVGYLSFVVGLPSCSSQSHMQALCTYRNHVLHNVTFFTLFHLNGPHLCSVRLPIQRSWSKRISHYLLGTGRWTNPGDSG